MVESDIGRRVAVIGTTGSGKTTLAGQIAARIGAPHVELDALYWDAGWREAPPEVFRARVDAALAGPGWATDGNYSKVRDIVWGRATNVAWLDYPLPLVLWRLTWRTLRRAAIGQELWNGNRERLREHFMSRESLLLWALKTHHRNRAKYPPLFRQPEYAHLRVVRLRSPRETRAWLAGLAAAVQAPSPS